MQKYNLSEQGLLNIKKGIRKKSIEKLKNKFPKFKGILEPYDSHIYLIKYKNNYIKIPIDKFVKKYNIDNRLYIEEEINEYLNSLILTEDDMLKNILIANEKLIHPKQNQKSFIKFYYPDIYKSIFLWTFKYSSIDFKERLFLFKNSLKTKPCCICCEREVNFSPSKKFYNTYCSLHVNSHHTSKKEKELYSFIKKIFNGNIIQNFKLNNNTEIDIFIPSINLGFEFNGLYWHSDEYKSQHYHYDKLLLAESNNINLVTIWEDDWDNKKDIIKSIILNKLNKNSTKIYARKTNIKNVNFNEYKLFLNKNHIQGWSQSSINIGLYYNDELVSLMTFGKKRNILNSSSENKNHYELIRFANSLNTTVIGGASKLFNYFIHTYNPEEIISYANLDISKGDLYKRLEFKNMGHTGINYWWVVDGERRHRSNFMKYKLIENGENKNQTADEIMRKKGYNKIYGNGNLKFIWKNVVS
jgi:hypothetical protein